MLNDNKLNKWNLINIKTGGCELSYKQFLMVISLTLFASGCAVSDQEVTLGTSEEDTLIIGIESEADVLDPHAGNGWVTMRINHQMYETLVAQDLTKSSEAAPIPELIPGLAESWEVSEDGKTYTFALREQVQFHDGTPFNADAVQFNIKRLTDPSFDYYYQTGASRSFRTWLYFESSEVIDDSTIKIHLSEPFREFPRLLALSNSLQIVSPTAIETYGNEGLANHPTGTGPFRFEERNRGENINIIKNDRYWGDPAQLDRVIFRPLSDPASRALAIRNDEVDIIAVPPADSLANFEEDGWNVVSGKPPHVWYMNFNFDNPIMQDKRVRQAMNYAIDREGIAEELLRGSVTPAYTMQTRGHAGYDSSRRWYEYNPEKAKSLLKEAGYENGFETTIKTSIDGSGQLVPVDIMEWIQRDLASVGIEATIDSSEWISYFAGFSNGMEEQVGMNQMSSGRTSPFWLAMVAHSSFSAPGGFNSGKYINGEVDQVLNAASFEENHVESLRLWAEAEQLIMEDAAFIPVLNDTAPYVVHPRVQNFIIPSEEWYDLSIVSIDQ